jgi:hypothetical protein
MCLLSYHGGSDPDSGGFQNLSKIRSSWLLGGVGLVAIAIALLAAPAQLEGPVLVPISPGHALSVLDSVALIPLLTGLARLYWGICATYFSPASASPASVTRNLTRRRSTTVGGCIEELVL